MPRLITLLLLLLVSWQVSAEVKKHCVSKSVWLQTVSQSALNTCQADETSNYTDESAEAAAAESDLVQDNSLILFMRVLTHFSDYFLTRIRQYYQLGIDSYSGKLLHRPPIL